MQDLSFGSVGTTAVFAVVIAVAVLLLFGLTCFSSKYTLRSKYGSYDPVFRATSRYNYMLTTDATTGLTQPYVHYRGASYLMFGNNGLLSRRQKAKKVDVLTDKQLTTFFPLKKYKDWMNGGKEEQENNYNGKIGYKDTFNTNEEPHNAETSMGNEDIEMSTDITELNTETEMQAQTSRKNVENDQALKNSYSVHASIVDTEKDLADVPVKTDTVISVKSVHPTEVSNTSASERGTQQLHFTSGTCTICLENLEDDDDVRGLLCGHVYHKDCIDPWLTKRKGSCPICKKDLYLEVMHDESANNDNEDIHSVLNGANQDRDVMNFDLNRIVRLPTGPPGSMEIDQMFSISFNNIFAFFMLIIITKVEAQTLLAAMIYLRNNNYSLDASISNEGEEDEENEEPDLLELVVTEIDHFGVASYTQRIADKFKQENAPRDGKSAPLPDMNNLNPQIKKLIEHHPRPFHPADLPDLDSFAWKETQRMRRGPKLLFFKFLKISEVDLYYHNVIRLYNLRRRRRLNAQS